MTTVVSRGARIAVEVLGDGDPVTVMAHGITGSRRDLGFFSPFLPGTKVLFDFRGHGLSERPGPGNYSMDHFAADVEAVADAFGATRMAGTSLGGGAGLRLLATKPDRFERLVFLLPARLDTNHPAFKKLLRTADMLEAHPIEKVTELLLEEEAAAGDFDAFPTARDYRRQTLMEMHPDGMPHAIREALGSPPVVDGAEAMHRISAPALVIAQEGDSVHHADVARDLAEALPNAELILFPDPFAMLREIPQIVQRVSAFLLEGLPQA